MVRVLDLTCVLALTCALAATSPPLAQMLTCETSGAYRLVGFHSRDDRRGSREIQPTTGARQEA
jgi:hypothetical protein